MNNFFKLTIIILIIITFIITFHFIGWLKPVENLIVQGSGAVQQRVYSLSLKVKSFYSNWISQKNLLVENNRLKEELKDYQIDQSKINSLEAENEVLKKELNFTEEYQPQFVAARIITGVSDPLSHSVIINRGTKDGVMEGMAVVAYEGVLVGKIYEVGNNFSKVLLLTDNKSRVAATIQNLGQTVGLVEGHFGLSFSMTNIPQDQEMKEGDLIVTSGLEGQIPKNLLIAKIESISQVESEIFKTAILSPIIPLNNLSYVLVIIP